MLKKILYILSHTWTNVIPSLLIPFFFIFLSPNLIWARGWCAGGDESFTEVFWSPQVFEWKDYEPFYFTFERLYDYTWNESPAKYKDNTEEWIAAYGRKPTREDVDSLLYTQTKGSFELLLNWVKEGKQPSEVVAQNSLAQAIKAKKDINAAEYLLFAKKCEKWVNIGTDPWAVDEPKKDPKAMMTLFAEGEKKWEAIEEPFLKRRYAFQCVRLAQYAGDPKKALAAYEKMFANDNSESVIKYWAMGHKAGALRALGMNVEANYLFSVIFDKCPSKRVNMYYSFHPESDAEWTKLMTKCRNNREKTTLFLLRAIDPYSQGMEEMENIAQIDPQSEYMTLLLVREICKLETSLMGYDFNYEFPIKMTYKPADMPEENQISASYLYKLRDYVVNKNETTELDNPAVWMLAQAYLQYLTGQYKDANITLDKLSEQGVSSKIAQKVQNFRFLIEVSQLKSLDLATEEKIFGDYLKLNEEKVGQEWERPIYDLMFKYFVRFYEKQGEIGKAFMCKEGVNGLLMQKADLAIIDNLLGIIDKPRTQFEKYLMDEIPEGKDLLLDIKGTEYWKLGDLKVAQEYYELTSPEYREKDNYFQVHFNPFDSFIKDCHECLEEKFQNNLSFNKLWIVNKMLSLEAEIATNPSKAVENYTKLGNAWYNITYYAPAWKSLAYYRTSYYFPLFSDDFIKPESSTGMSEMTEEEQNRFFQPDFDMKRPMDYYQKALDAKPNKEQAMLLQFMITKCQLNLFYTGKSSRQEVIDMYQQMKQKYADTKYYSEVLRECKYFASYVKGKK